MQQGRDPCAGEASKRTAERSGLTEEVVRLKDGARMEKFYLIENKATKTLRSEDKKISSEKIFQHDINI